MTTLPGIFRLCSLEIVIGAVLLGGCTTSYRVTTNTTRGDVSFEEFQKAVVGNAVIFLKDTSISVGIQEVRQDSVTYEVPFQQSQSVALADISRIQYKNRIQGMGEWAPVGALVGAAVWTGVLAGIPKADPGAVVMIGVGVGTITGGPLGAIAGLIIGHTYEYRLKDGPEK